MHPLQALEFSTRIAKRAQYEAFEFTLCRAGITVRNGSHADPSDHEYLVRIADGIPVACECPADENYEGACKHRVAVAIRRPLLDAHLARDDPQPVVADGGHTTPASTDERERNRTADEPAATAGEECSACLDDFPCWECVRTGRKDLPE